MSIDTVQFNLSKIYFPRISSEINPNYIKSLSNVIENSSGNFSINIHGNIIFENTLLVCTLNSLVIFNNENYKDIARINISTQGYFNFTSEVNKEIINTFHSNFYAIMFPYVRQAIHELALKNNISILIPIINVDKIVKDNVERFTIKHSSETIN